MKPPIFVCGCPHSGASLMQAILGSHSNIHFLKGETRLFINLPKDHNTMINKFNAETLGANKDRWVEKSPEHIHKLDRIFQRYEKAKIIVMVKDGRDVVASLIRRIDYDLEEAISRWINDNTIALDYEQHSNVLLVHYEDLITNFRDTLIIVFNFINEKYETQVENFYEYYDKAKKPHTEYSRNAILELRAWQITQPLFDGRGRRSELEEPELKLINEMCGEMLERLGYDL